MGKERIDEIFDPEIAMNRAIDYYRSRGYSDKWIEARLKGITKLIGYENMELISAISLVIQMKILNKDLGKN